MPTDITYPFSYTEQGDIQTVSERDFYEQHAFLIGVEVLDGVSGQPITTNETTEIIDQLETAYQSSPYFSDRTRVSLAEKSREQISLAVAVDGGTTVETTIPFQ